MPRIYLRSSSPYTDCGIGTGTESYVIDFISYGKWKNSLFAMFHSFISCDAFYVICKSYPALIAI
jgi:hypothetical protein